MLFSLQASPAKYLTYHYLDCFFNPPSQRLFLFSNVESKWGPEAPHFMTFLSRRSGAISASSVSTQMSQKSSLLQLSDHGLSRGDGGMKRWRATREGGCLDLTLFCDSRRRTDLEIHKRSMWGANSWQR